MYKTEDLYSIAEEAIIKNRLIFIEDIIAYLPCRKSTFYEHFPNESDLYKKMFDLLEINRTELKVSLRSKWYKSNAPALQMALMKLICNDEERKKLSMTYSDVTTDGDKINKHEDIDSIKQKIDKLMQTISGE